MKTLLLLVVTSLGYILAYRLYGRYLSEKIFKLSKEAVVPSVKLNDGIDYIPTKKDIIFGHHFTSIAGTGPIVGPAIAIIWGWVPAMLWIFFGSIFMGAVHDFGSLVVSLRNDGRSISDLTGKYINSRMRFLFFAIVFLELLIVIAIFGLVIAVIFNMYPASIFPVWFEIPIAIVLGYLVYNRKMKELLPSIIALILMYLTVIIGYYFQFTMPTLFGIPPTGVWTIILLIYAFIASVMPVTTLLQPRDYINSHQLVVAMGLIILGTIMAAFTTDLTIVAPSFNLTPKDGPPIWPLLFITIACGAISGFHSMVSSGTSSKQLSCETDALFVGYGSMLMEGFLATLVIIAVASGIGLGHNGLTGIEAWNDHYSSWTAAKGLGSKITAFVSGSANLIATLGIPKFIALTIMGVFVASFASTTLDSATRIQRYVISELFSGVKLFQNRFVATGFAVITAAVLAFATGATGKGALKLWPLFGAVNQTLAALALIVITIYLKRNFSGRKWLVAGVPAVIMLIITIYATIYNEISFISSGNIMLSFVGGIVVIIVIWSMIEGTIALMKKTTLE